jgi:hypothetical protein
MPACWRGHWSGSWCWAAVCIHWILIQGIGMRPRDVFQGVTIGAALIGVAYLADIIPGPREP